MSDKVFKIFVDFDGTISKNDVGDQLFREFGESNRVESIIDKLLNDQISAKECWIQLCESIEKVDEHELHNFIQSMEIDKGFHNFVKFCRARNIDFYVLSDGFDMYIDKIFKREGLDDIKVYCNKLEIKNNKLKPIFPYEHRDCRTSANCKRNHIINNSADEDYTVYIGDGNSDKYTSQFCDFIFAKNDLLKFCEKERISFFPYREFDEVVERLDYLYSKRNIKKRHQASLKRKEIYMQE